VTVPEEPTAEAPTAAPPRATSTTLQRDELLREHAEQRRRRDASPLGGAEFQAAAMRIAEIEVEIARLERAAGLG
jgi:hypothetical protein